MEGLLPAAAWPRLALGFDRVVVSEIEVPNMFSGSGIQWMGGGAERQHARARADEHQGVVKLDLATLPFRVRLLHRTRLYFQPRRRHESHSGTA